MRKWQKPPFSEEVTTLRRIVILFGLFLALAAIVPCDAAKRGLPDAVIPDCLGVNIHFVGDNDKEVKMIADAGFRMVRMDFLWEWVETEKGKYDFSKYDTLMAALDRHGVRAMFILDYGNPLYPYSYPLVGDEARTAFVAFARAAATHFKDRGIIWEIWNEPNYRSFSAQDYTKLALPTAKAIHEADPAAKVLGPTSATIDMSYLGTVFSQGGLKELDAVTVHPYRGGPPESTAAEYAAVYEMIRQNSPAGKTIPLLSGEWGYTMTSVSEEQQAQYLVRMFLANLASNVNYSIWYDWSDDGLDPNYGEHHFGTVYNDLKPKQAYYAMQALSRQLDGYRLVRRIQTENPEDYLLILKRDKSYKLAVWTIGKAHEIDLPMDVSTVVLADMYGNRKPATVANGVLKLNLDQSVVYADILGNSKRLALEEAWDVAPAATGLANSTRLPVRYTFTNKLGAPVQGVATFIESETSKVLASLPLNAKPGASVDAICNLRTIWNGDGPIDLTAEFKLVGMNTPIRRTLQFDTAKFLAVSATPPLADTETIFIQNPSGEAFTGAVRIKGEQGASIDASIPVKLAKGQTSAVVSCANTSADAGKCALKIELLDAKKKVIYSPTPFTFKQVTAFDDGSKVGVIMDGDGGVPVSTKQITADLPEKLTGAVSCTKIDYSFGNGWRYAKFNSNPVPAIDGQPKYAGVWVYGNESNDMVCIRLLDASGQVFQPASYKLDFKGWRFFTWSLSPSRMAHWQGASDGMIRWPLRWDTQLIIDSNQKEHSGSLYVGPMWLIY